MLCNKNAALQDAGRHFFVSIIYGFIIRYGFLHSPLPLPS